MLSKWSGSANHYWLVKNGGGILVSSFGLAHEELSRALSSAHHTTAAEAQQHSSSPWTDGQMLPPLRLLSTLDTPGQYIYTSNLHICCVSVEKQHARLLGRFQTIMTKSGRQMWCSIMKIWHKKLTSLTRVMHRHHHLWVEPEHGTQLATGLRLLCRF